jgi:hypothetical protein
MIIIRRVAPVLNFHIYVAWTSGPGFTMHENVVSFFILQLAKSIEQIPGFFLKLQGAK